MMEIFIPIIVVVAIVLTKFPVLRPSVLFIVNKMTHFFSSFVNLPL